MHIVLLANNIGLHFVHSLHHAENVLDIVHTDVCSMTKKSHGGALYFVTFIDDHSRKVFVYVLKHKYQTLEAFKEFHAKVERETGRKL